MTSLSMTQLHATIRCTASPSRSHHMPFARITNKTHDSVQPHDPSPSHNASISRRASLIGLSLLTLKYTSPAAAITDEDLNSLPKSYQDTVRSLINALRDSIDADINGEPEREVRRKADPAKDLVRQFMTRWKDSDEVKDTESYIQIVDAIQQLGQFYLSKGQRARMDKTVADSLLLKLDKAELALPPEPEKKSLLPF